MRKTMAQRFRTYLCVLRLIGQTCVVADCAEFCAAKLGESERKTLAKTMLDDVGFVMYNEQGVQVGRSLCIAA